MTILNEQTVELLGKELQLRIDDYHDMFTFPLKGEMWEEVLSKALKSIGLDNDWQPTGSHKSGSDMKILQSNERVSCKSGTIKQSGTLTLSGSRSTKYKTLREKIEFFSNKQEDLYALLAKPERKKGVIPSYEFILFSTEILNYKNLRWAKNASGKTYEAESRDLRCKIVGSMSGQLWTDIKKYKQNAKIFCSIPIIPKQKGKL